MADTNSEEDRPQVMWWLWPHSLIWAGAVIAVPVVVGVALARWLLRRLGAPDSV